MRLELIGLKSVGFDLSLTGMDWTGRDGVDLDLTVDLNVVF